MNRGIVFSILWGAGAGSLYAIVLARRAHRIIANSTSELSGMRRVWWCYLVGGLGVALLLMVATAVLINR